MPNSPAGMHACMVYTVVTNSRESDNKLYESDATRIRGTLYMCYDSKDEIRTHPDIVKERLVPRMTT